MCSHDTINLRLNGLPVINDINDLSGSSRLSAHTLYNLSFYSNKYYKCYEIEKKSGKKRLIAQPSRKMKGLQAWILYNILNKLQSSPSSKGFEKGTSIVDNVRPHIQANAVLVVDLLDFFPSIKKERVFHLFKSIGYNNTISTIFTKICTYNDSLPQGGPCSPKIANLILWHLDARIQGYAGRRGIKYTRYADDLTFSGLSFNSLIKILPFIKRIISEEGFQINHNKTRFAGNAKAKIITGLILNENGFGIGTKKYRLYRSIIFRSITNNEQDEIKVLQRIFGILSYVRSVDLNRYDKLEKYIGLLNQKHNNSISNKLSDYMGKH